MNTKPLAAVGSLALWIPLQTQVIDLHSRWRMYRELYAASEEQVAVLNRIAPDFFSITQNNMLSDIQVTLCKLGDPAGGGTRTNLTVLALRDEVNQKGDAPLADKLTLLCNNYNDACLQVTHRRNKYLAHFDRTTMLSEHVTPLEGPSRAEIENALKKLRELMNCVETHYTGCPMKYEWSERTSDVSKMMQTFNQARDRKLTRLLESRYSCIDGSYIQVLHKAELGKNKKEYTLAHFTQAGNNSVDCDAFEDLANIEARIVSFANKFGLTLKKRVC